MEIQRIVGTRGGIHRPNSKLRVDFENGAFEHDAVAHLPTVFLGQFHVHHGAGTVPLPAFHLLRRHRLVRVDLQILARICGELGEEILRLVVLVAAAEPGHRDHTHNSGQRADFVAIETWQEDSQRNPVTGDEPFGGLGSPLVDIKAAPDGHHEGEQQQRKADAEDRQQAPAFVAKSVLRHEASQGHNGIPEILQNS